MRYRILLLSYLIAIEQQHLFEQLFEKVLVPVGVHEELTDVHAPEKVRQCVRAPLEWYEVRDVGEGLLNPLPIVLHKGERQAIVLAETLRADVLLIDEQAGREIALARKIPVSGTLGILERADVMGLVSDFPKLLHELKASGFFIAQPLERLLLERHRRRGKHG